MDLFYLLMKFVISSDAGFGRFLCNELTKIGIEILEVIAEFFITGVYCLLYPDLRHIPKMTAHREIPMS